MIKKICFIFSCILFVTLTSKMAFSFEINSGERIKLYSKALNENREIQIILPENYHSNPEASYPVIYLLDGDYTLHGVSGMLDFLSNKAQLIPDVIIVGIADQGTEKYRQYMTPEGLTAPLKKENSGKAKLFLAFIEKELKTYVHKHYRAANNNILVGQSIAGLFVINALLESPAAFEHFVAISPAVWLNDHAILNKVKKVIQKNKPAATSLYLSFGDEQRQGVYGLVHLLDEHQPKHITWRFNHYPEENHNSVGLVALRANLKQIFQSWYLSDKTLESAITPEEIISHYQKQLAILAINQPIPTPSIKSAIRYFYRQDKTKDISSFVGKVKEKLPASEQAFIIMQASYLGYTNSSQAALTLLKKSEDRFKSSVEYLKSIASTYEQLKKYSLAMQYYKKALALAHKYHANQWQINIINAKIKKVKASA